MLKEKITLTQFKYKITNSERLPTNTFSHQYRVQRWANFIAGFSIEFVEKCLETRNPINDIVFDPFLGCGTTLVTAKNRGFKGIGYDRHPIFYNLARAKLGTYSSNEILIIKKALYSKKNNIIWSEDSLKFLKKLFEENDLNLISFASYSINYNLNEKLKPLAIAIFLRSCELTCGAQTDGIYKAPTSKKKHISFHSAIDTTCNMFIEDIETDWYKNHWSYTPNQISYNNSSTTLKYIEDETFGVCITSPPYLNNFDYAEMTRMHLYLLGWSKNWGDISINIRNNLITNTTTALKNKKSKIIQNLYRSSLPNILLTDLDDIVLDLTTQRKTRAGKKEYDYIVYPYYFEIQKVLKELYRTLKKNGEVFWVIADAALYGIHIKTHIHTAEIMKAIGFKDVRIKFIRRRGHRWILNKRDGAKEDLGEYFIYAKKT